MNQIKKFNKTLEYLEKCLDTKIDEKEIFYISGYSYPLFARVFSIISGITLSDYLRFRKLTRAAIDIANSEDKIIDIALKYGYESQNSFTVAFKNFHKITPREVRKGYKYTIFSPVNFILTIEGGNTMDIKVERRKGFCIAGISVNTGINTNFSKLWEQLIASKEIKFLSSIGSGQAYGACFNFIDRDNFSYMAGYDVENKNLAISKGLEILEVPEADYAIIPLKGKIPDCIHEGWKYVVTKFLPENNLKHSGTPDIEVYGSGDINSDKYEMQLWVPVEKIK